MLDGMSFPRKSDTPYSYFVRARTSVEMSAFSKEVDWLRSVRVDSISESEFLREAAWVVVNSGFRESTARRLFPHISLAFFDWRSAGLIAEQSERCIEIASCVFRHDGKLRAIAQAAEIVDAVGMANIRVSLLDEPVEFLKSFSYIGPITVWHLAKNLGCDVAKPDRHLVRLATYFGFDCVQRFCGEIAEAAQERISVVDLILWRFIASQNHFAAHR